MTPVRRVVTGHDEHGAQQDRDTDLVERSHQTSKHPGKRCRFILIAATLRGQPISENSVDMPGFRAFSPRPAWYLRPRYGIF